MNKLLHYALGGLLFSYVFSSYIATDSNDNKKVLKDDGNLNGSIGDVAEFPKINRGKHVSAQVTPEELYEAYESIRNEYDEKAFTCDSEDMNSPYAGKSTSSSQKNCHGKWEILRQSEGIEVSLLKHASDPNCPYVRMSGIMPGPIDDVWDFLRLERWDKVMPKMDPFYDGLEISKRYIYKGKKNKKPIEITLVSQRLITMF